MNTQPDRLPDADPPLSRRRFLGGAAAAVAAGWLSSGSFALAQQLGAAAEPTSGTTVQALADQRYKIAVADIMIIKRQSVGAFQRTHEIGADGVEVDMGQLGDRETFNSKLGDPATRQQFLDEAKKFNLEICSLGMTGFFSQSFPERPTVPRMVQDCIDAMVAMNVKTAFLPLGVPGDMVAKPEMRPVIVKRFKELAPLAEKAGVVIGVETALEAKEEVKFLDEIGSPAIRIYYNFANGVKPGRDMIQELKTLGKERICQIHASNGDRVWLENDDAIDMPRVKQTLDEMGWRGWLVIERSRDATVLPTNSGPNVVKNFGANARFLKKIFQAA